MAEWINACAADAVEAEGAVRFDHGPRTFVIVRDHEDNYYCMDGLCTHEAIHLADGLVMEATIECPKHASIFDAKTGRVETPPACENLRTYRTRIDDGRVFVEV
jgi:3-phenylpropionate/trans-cinnamate dioxygenase ferredoxin subunit